VSSSEVKLKEQVRQVVTYITDDMRKTLPEDIHLHQWQNTVRPQDRNKLEFMEFLRVSVDENIQEEKDELVVKVNLDKVKKLCRYAKPYYNHAQNKSGRDFMDLEKSFRTYRAFYPLTEVRPLKPADYQMFQSLRDAQLGRYNERFYGEIHHTDLLSYKESLDDLFEKAGECVEAEESITRHETGHLLADLDDMKEDAQAAYNTAKTKSILDDENSVQHYETVLGFGYTAFALAHFVENKEVAFGKRLFLVEQTGRVLQYLVS